MTRKGITLIEIIVVLAIIGILAAILFPAFTRSSSPFYNAHIPPQQFKQVPLESVMAHLNRGLEVSRRKASKSSVPYLKKIEWQNEALKRRRVTLSTKTRMPLKEVLEELEKVAQVEIDFGPERGRHEGFAGPTTIRDTAGRTP